MYNNNTFYNNNNNNNNNVLTRGQVLLLNNMMTIYQSNNNLIGNLGNDNITVINNLLSINNRISNTIIDLFMGRRQQERRSNQNLFYFTDVLSNNSPSMHNSVSEPQNADLLSFFTTLLQPIEIHPTPAQIEDATRIVRFGDIINPINDSCPISLNAFHENDNVSVIRHCNHVFNTTELNNWFLGNCRCPVCRYDIRTIINNTRDLSNNVLQTAYRY